MHHLWLGQLSDLPNLLNKSKANLQRSMALANTQKKAEFLSFYLIFGPILISSKKAFSLLHDYRNLEIFFLKLLLLVVSSKFIVKLEGFFFYTFNCLFLVYFSRLEI